MTFAEPPVLISPPPPNADVFRDDNYWTPSVWNHVQFGWGCVRFDRKSSTGKSVTPRLHVNRAHNACGIVRVYTDWNAHPAERDLLFETEGGGAIGTMFVLPDETMVGMGVLAGVSGGQPKTACRIHLNGKRVAATDIRLYHPYANLWCFWVWAKQGPSPLVQALERAADAIGELRERVTYLERQLNT